MKKGKLFAFLGLGILSASAIVFGAVKGLEPRAVAVYAEEESTEVVVETEAETEIEEFECKVVVKEAQHGNIVVDKLEGHVGEIVTINAVHDMFYLVESVTVNGTGLVENENVSGKFTFALVEGDNVIAATFVIDEELLGEMSVIVDQINNKDWTNLFSVENIVRVVTFVLNGGILIAIVRYFIKDKKLEKKVEDKVEEVVQKIIPDSTRETVTATVEQFITPYFAKIEAEFGNVEHVLTVFSRCFALAQENTPESRIAIVQELSELKIADQEAIAEIESKIKAFMEEQSKVMAEMIAKLNDAYQKNAAVLVNGVTDAVEELRNEAEPSEDTPVVPYE